MIVGFLGFGVASLLCGLAENLTAVVVFRVLQSVMAAPVVAISQAVLVDTFPEEAEDPSVQELTIESQVINVTISGPAGEKTLRRLGERARDDGA